MLHFWMRVVLSLIFIQSYQRNHFIESFKFCSFFLFFYTKNVCHKTFIFSLFSLFVSHSQTFTILSVVSVFRFHQIFCWVHFLFLTFVLIVDFMQIHLKEINTPIIDLPLVLFVLLTPTFSNTKTLSEIQSLYRKTSTMNR